jgi:hypothetical protein
VPLPRADSVASKPNVPPPCAPDLDIHLRDRGGRTALFLAVEKGYTDVIEALLNRGASPNVGDNRRFMPLHAAAVQVGEVAGVPLGRPG